MEHYSALKRNKALIDAAIEINAKKHYAKWKKPDARLHIV